MPLNKLKFLDSELKRIDSEYVNLKVPEDSEHAKEIRDMKKEGISLEDVKSAD
ncbi:MAG TPA: hypothetical protein VJ485_00825 [archaeon]|jgi:hypothetical protein|nr:hypothetical protein [archaeon]